VEISVQITFASPYSLEISSSTFSTKTPPSLSRGAFTSSTTILGSTSIPKSSSLIASTLFFLAFKMLLTLANLGVFNLKSQLKIAGRDTWTFYKPKSTSLKTLADVLSSAKFISELNVTAGIPIFDARIYDVWT